MPDMREPTIVILAGGRATRLAGADKALACVGGVTLLDRVLARVQGQTDTIVLNANGDPSRFDPYHLPVVADDVPDRPGPLAGLLAGMEWSRAHRPAAADIVSVPVDTPFVPRDLVARLLAAREAAGTVLAIARSGGQTHPVVGLWPVRLAASLRRALTVEGVRRVRDWVDRHGTAYADCPADGVDPFFNVNRPEDLQTAAACQRDDSCSGRR